MITISFNNYDGSFVTSASANGAVRAIAQNANGDLIVAGAFTQVSGSTRNRIAALDADGTLLSTFANGANAAIWSIVPRIDGSFYVAGAFTSIAGQARGRVARLSANGEVLAGFDGQVSDLVRAMAVQPDGKVLIGGTFETVAGLPRAYLARLSVPEAVRHQIQWDQGNQQVRWYWQGPAPDAVYAPRLQVSTECCASDSFIPMPGGADMTGGAFGSQRVYTLGDFPGMSGTFYLRTATTTGDFGGVGMHVQYSPAWRFDGGETDDTIFANGFESP